MKRPVVIVGVGEIGGVFARGILRAGHPVYPITRGMDMNVALHDISEPEAVVVAVGEKDLHATLEALPPVWRDRTVLIQNELLPQDWERHSLHAPTVMSVWFEKKRPADYKVIIPSPVHGPKAGLIKEAMGGLDISVKMLGTEEELLEELVLKNLYILTTNIAGLAVGGTVGELWGQHQDVARAVGNAVLDIQFALIGRKLDRERLFAGMVAAFEGDPAHKCMGRSAPARLARAIDQAKDAGLEVKVLEEMRKDMDS